MIGIDIARIKRWYAKTYPVFCGTGFDNEVTNAVQTAIDATHDLDGVSISFTIKSYNSTTKEEVTGSSKSGVYERMHYGGWKISE